MKHSAKKKSHTKRQYLAGTGRKKEGEESWDDKQAKSNLSAQERRAKDAEDPIKLSEFKPADFWK